MLIGNGTLLLGDCLERMEEIPSGSVQMILADLPYATTRNAWDSLIPFEPLWAQYRRICTGAVVLTAAQPFTSALVSSNYKGFRYEWIWEKEPSGNLNAKKMPMAAHESVLVFGEPIYSPQGLRPTLKKRMANGVSKTSNYGHQVPKDYEQTATGYPSTVLSFAKERGLHPTQKPVALFEYLIRTYTQPGDTVLDNCLGSGTTAIAAERSGRRWIGIERDEGYYNAALARIWTECAA